MMSLSSPTLESASACEDWQLAEDGHKPASLLVHLRRRAYVLPWFRFVSAEGDDAKVKIIFASHEVNVTGYNLATLLTALAAQRVIRLVEPTENEAKFGVRGANANKYTGPAIAEISVEQTQ